MIPTCFATAIAVVFASPVIMHTSIPMSCNALIACADDGRGAPAHEGGGHGLTGLRERAQSVGGTVEAGAGPDGGFRGKVRVPRA